MATIGTTPATNPQLAGILATVPSIVNLPNPNNASSITLGGPNGANFNVPTSPSPTLPTAPPLPGIGTLVVGGGSTPAAGAQPAAPNGAAAVSTTVTPAASTTTPANTDMTTGGGMSIEASGFGKAERDQPINVAIGGATFGFPSFNSTARSNAAPAISWGPGWSKVEKGGMYYMEHANGAKAIPAVEYRITPNPAEKVSTVKVANGWGKKFPDGTVLVIDRKEGPYKLDPQGNKHKVAPGTHTIGGVKVRVFEASVVRTLDKDGSVNVFDSRGNRSDGTKRGRIAAALGAASAGASVSGGGASAKTETIDNTSGPSTQVAGKGGMTVAAGGAATSEQMTKNVQQLTEIARGLVAEIRSGNVDSVKLASLQAQLGAVPAGILQAAGAAGTITSDGRTLRHVGEVHAPASGAAATPAATPAAAARIAATPAGAAPTASTPAGSTPAAPASTPPKPPTSSATPGTITGNAGTNAATSGGGAAAPVAGVDANAATKAIAAGMKMRLDGASVPAELHGKQARFAQLPDALQAAVAKAFGSDQGSGALKADQLVAFTAAGEVSLVGGGTVFTRHQSQVRGAGPGEELALTVRPGRQPGSVGSTNVNLTTRPSVQGGGSIGTTGANGSTGHGSGHAGPTGGLAAASSTSGVGSGIATRPVTSGSAVGGGAATSTNKIAIFAAGSEVRDVQFGGLDGSYTWSALPATARTALMAQINDPSSAAGKAFASRTGSGWRIDPNAMIVLGSGFASFVNGLNLVRDTTPAVVSSLPSVTPPVAVGGPSSPPVAGGGPSSSPVGHNATRPPVSGGGGISTVRPGTAPPVADRSEVPRVSDGGSGTGHGAHGGH